jgi:deoxyribonuclease V
VKIANLHRWNLSFEAARALQVELRESVRFQPVPLARVRFVAGADIAVSRSRDELIAAVVVVELRSLEVVETRVVSRRLVFPYVPGYLSFREAPAVIACLRLVRTPVDVLLCDGQGIAHPRGLGLASHVGLWVGIPTVGCAKSRLVGEFVEPGRERGKFSSLVHEGERVGSVLRTRDGVKPLFVSPGHLIDHASSRRVVLACTAGYRLPEPSRLAHIAAGEEKRRLASRP